ncbi:MAG: outer membrane beta-barrel protein [Aquificae bacterium]|nr:outer membrane beta-barrel protein [Aquificota bacterium]
MRKLKLIAAATLVSFSLVNAGSLKVLNSDVEMAGGITASYFYMDNVGEEPKDQFSVTNLDFDLSSNFNSYIRFEAGLGAAHLPDLLEPVSEAEFEVEFAWLEIQISENSVISAGKLLTNVGYELFDTFNNPNYHYGLVWWGQPVNYAGARFTYSLDEDIQFYAEYNHDTAGAVAGITPRDAAATGIIGSIGNFNFALNYFDYANTKNLVDVVFATQVANFDVALNIDYQWLDDGPKDSLKTLGAKDVEDYGYGVALYLIPHVTDKIIVPVRIEFVYDGKTVNQNGEVIDEGIYGIAGDDAWSFTITPTWAPTKNTYIRGEFAYVVTDEKGFENEDGEEEDNRSFVGVELGFLF